MQHLKVITSSTLNGQALKSSAVNTGCKHFQLALSYHARDAASVPIDDGLVEVAGAPEHALQGVAARKLKLNATFESSSIMKHPCQALKSSAVNTGCKHFQPALSYHARDAASVPIDDGLVEVAGAVEHALQGVVARTL